MKKIINGKMYDTETAKEVGFHANGGGWRDFHHYEETLYRKRTGEYFLFGEGGPMTHYAKSTGQNSWSGGSEIIPMTVASAQKWAEENMDADDYQKEFGPVSEDEARVTMTISLDAATADRIRKAAAEQGTSVSAMIAGKF